MTGVYRLVQFGFAAPVRVAETLIKVIDEIDIFADAGLRVSASIGIACKGCYRMAP